MPENSGSPLQPLEKPFVDERGVIQPLLDKNLRDVAIVHSKPGAIRANHYHREAWHNTYIISGKMTYHWRKVGDTNPPQSMQMKAGDLLYTPPRTEHAMQFEEETVMLEFSGSDRSHENYEKDTVRIKLI